MTYGVTDTGFVVKPIADILTEIEAANITEFGADVIQTSQSPLGQINGIIAAMVHDLWTMGADIYESLDPDTAENNRLDTIARLRLITRGGIADADLRQLITNADRCNISIQDITTAIKSVAGVTDAWVYENDTGEVDADDACGTLAFAIIGGDDTELAEVLEQYVTPGVNTYGNYRVNSEAMGYCRSINIIRPVEIPVQLNITLTAEAGSCPLPGLTAIKAYFIEQWSALNKNGKDVTFAAIRKIIESNYADISVSTFSGAREYNDLVTEAKIDISFFEISTIISDDVVISFA